MFLPLHSWCSYTRIDLHPWSSWIVLQWSYGKFHQVQNCVHVLRPIHQPKDQHCWCLCINLSVCWRPHDRMWFHRNLCMLIVNKKMRNNVIFGACIRVLPVSCLSIVNSHCDFFKKSAMKKLLSFQFWLPDSLDQQIAWTKRIIEVAPGHNKRLRRMTSFLNLNTIYPLYSSKIHVLTWDFYLYYLRFNPIFFLTVLKSDNPWSRPRCMLNAAKSNPVSLSGDAAPCRNKVFRISSTISKSISCAGNARAPRSKGSSPPSNSSRFGLK